MSVILIHPRLTRENQDALTFVSAWKDETTKHLPVTTVDTAVAARAQPVGRGDHVLFVNGPEADFDPAVLRLLERGATAGATIYPVALEIEYRMPPVAVGAVQSYDVTEELRRRSLGRQQLPIVAVAFSHTVVARSQPTLSKERMRLFLSHRRLDGETITYEIWRELRLRGEVRGVFRDVADVRVGDDAQEVIMERLALSDTVVFLDTPKTGESEWIARELEEALALNLPIVWIRIGRVEERVPLRVVPGQRPHLELPDLDPAAARIDPLLADQILDAAFAVSREAATRIFESLDRLDRLERSGRVEARLLDPARLLYEIRLPRVRGRYAERPLRQLVQFFGRWPGEEDALGFGPCACEVGFEPHPVHGPPFDAAVLAAPIPSQTHPPAPRDGGGVPCYIDAADAYLRELEEITSPVRKLASWGIVLSGAFPDVDPEHEQEVKSAVHSFALAVFNRGGTVIFGGHPTFQPMVFQIGRDHLSANRVDRTRLYVSGYFVTEAAADEMRKDASTHWIPPVGGNRTRSLTEMRKAMISDDRARALVAIGGREPSPGRTPGVDEEIELAQRKGLPVFLIAAAGGRTATLASQQRSTGWQSPLNELVDSENEELFQSREYGILAELVLSRLGL